MSRLRAFVAAYRKRRFAVLFYALLFALGIHPVFEVVLPGVDLTEWMILGTLAAALASVELGRRVRSLLVVSAAFLVLRLAHPILQTPVIFSLSQFFWIVAFVITTGLTVEHVFRDRESISERVFAALDAYLLAGFTFGAAYWLLEHELPGSFGPGITDLSFQKAIYLSFFTLTTLGLGNAVPSNGPAMGLMIFEAIAGQLYLTVLVARLVSLYGSGK